MKSRDLDSIGSILSASDFKLPLTVEEDPRASQSLFDVKALEYRNKISKLDESCFGDFEKEVFLELLDILIKQISQSISFYLEGFPSAAYNTLNEVLSIPEISSILTAFRSISIPRHHTFFRTKREFDSEKYLKESKGDLICGDLGVNPLDLFHVPFDRRKAIGTNRFSIPGFPCLYLSDTIQASWSEIVSKENDSFHAICFKNHRPLYIIDVSPINYSIDEITKDSVSKFFNQDTNDKYLNDYALIYPIILSCHIKVLYKSSYAGEVQFRSEYIIPQLLMQWFRNAGFMVDGLRYISCTAHLKLENTSCNCFNYVIPVESTLSDNGYCNGLLHNFSASNVYSTIQSPKASFSVSELNDISKVLLDSKFYPLTKHLS